MTRSLTLSEERLMPETPLLPSREAVAGGEYGDLPTYLQEVLLPLALAWQSGRLVDREAIDWDELIALRDELEQLPVDNQRFDKADLVNRLGKWIADF